MYPGLPDTHSLRDAYDLRLNQADIRWRRVAGSASPVRREPAAVSGRRHAHRVGGMFRSALFRALDSARALGIFDRYSGTVVGTSASAPRAKS